MNYGLFTKAVREARMTTLLFGVGALVFEIILAAVLPTLSQQLERSVLQIPFFRTVIQALIGTDIGDQLGPLVVGSIAWVHPVLLALLSAGELNVKDLTQILGQSQPRISRHLKLLSEAGLIERFREGSGGRAQLGVLFDEIAKIAFPGQVRSHQGAHDGMLNELVHLSTGSELDPGIDWLAANLDVLHMVLGVRVDAGRPAHHAVGAAVFCLILAACGPVEVGPPVAATA